MSNELPKPYRLTKSLYADTLMLHKTHLELSVAHLVCNSLLFANKVYLSVLNIQLS